MEAKEAITVLRDALVNAEAYCADFYANAMVRGAAAAHQRAHRIAVESRAALDAAPALQVEAQPASGKSITYLVDDLINSWTLYKDNTPEDCKRRIAAAQAIFEAFAARPAPAPELDTLRADLAEMTASYKAAVDSVAQLQTELTAAKEALAAVGDAPAVEASESVLDNSYLSGIVQRIIEGAYALEGHMYCRENFVELCEFIDDRVAARQPVAAVEVDE